MAKTNRNETAWKKIDVSGLPAPQKALFDRVTAARTALADTKEAKALKAASEALEAAITADAAKVLPVHRELQVTTRFGLAARVRDKAGSSGGKGVSLAAYLEGIEA